MECAATSSEHDNGDHSMRHSVLNMEHVISESIRQTKKKSYVEKDCVSGIWYRVQKYDVNHRTYIWGMIVKPLPLTLLSSILS